MKWKDADDPSELNHDNREDQFEENYSPLKSSKLSFATIFSFLAKTPLLWIIPIAVVLIVFALIFSKGGNEMKQLEEYNERIAQLEKKVMALEEINDLVTEFDKNQKNVKALLIRLDRLETTMASKLNEMAKQMNRMEQNTTSVSAGQSGKQGGKEKIDGKYHTVRKGDTLYSISRQYGLKVEQLMTLNKLKKGADIFPGQKLIIKQ